jgi:hypothetical protein
MKPMTRTWSAALAGTAASAALAAAMMTSVNALADTTATVATPDAANASVTNLETPTYKKILDRTNVTFLSQWYGSSVGKIKDPVQPDEYGKTKEAGNDPQEFDNTLLTTYKIDDSGTVVGFAVNETFYMNSRGHTFYDPYLKIAKANLIKNGNFNYTADFRTYLPVSYASHNSDRLTRFRSFSTANYDIPNTKFSLQSFNDINYYVFGSSAKNDAKDFLLAIQPTINYQMLQPLGFFVGYEMDTKHTKDKPAFDLTAAGTWLYVGTSWDITPKMNFSPYLALRPGGAVNADSTEIQAYFTYKLL